MPNGGGAAGPEPSDERYTAGYDVARRQGMRARYMIKLAWNMAQMSIDASSSVQTGKGELRPGEVDR
jgi:hypothetical protein